MRRQPPGRVWYSIEVVTSLYGAMVFTFTAVYFVRELGVSPLRLPIVLGGLTMVVLAVALVLLMPERGFSPAPRGERSSWQAMTGTARAGARLVRRTPLLVLLLGIVACWGTSSESFDRL